MLRKVFNLISVLLIGIGIMSCQDKNTTDPTMPSVPQINHQKPASPEEYGEFTLQDNVVFIAEAYEDFIVEVIDSTAIVLRNDIGQDLYPEVGDIIYCMATKNSPYGFTGKVTSIEITGEQTKFSTENVQITDIFKELHLDMPIEFPDNVTYMIDENGETVECKVVSNDIWNDIEKEGVGAETKVEVGATSYTLELKAKDCTYFDGSIYIGVDAGFKLDLSSGKLNYIDFYANTRCGIKGDLKLINKEEKNEIKFKVIDKDLKAPSVMLVGPLVFITTLGLEDGFKLNGKTEMTGGLAFELDNSTYSFKYQDGEWNATSSRNQGVERCFTLSKLETTGEAGIYSNTSIGLSPYHKSILRIGISTEADFKLSAGTEISFDEKELLQINPEIKLSRELETGIFIESDIFNKFGKDTKLGLFTKQTLTPISVKLFPKFTDVVTKKVNGAINGIAKIDKDNLIKTEEEGFALFKKNEKDSPVEHKKMEIRSTKASSEGAVSFEVSNPEEYTIKPYVKADGKYFYFEDRWVDLGLPSGILWAAYNVGASSPEEYGGYYAWGETKEKSIYTDGNYDWNIGPYISSTQYDVAHVKWGDGARMPSIDEIKELIDICNWSASLYNGAQATGPNGNSIFIPFAGYKEDGEIEDNKYVAYLWSCNADNDNEDAYAFYCYFDSDGLYSDWDLAWEDVGRCLGLPIRPVKDKESENK